MKKNEIFICVFSLFVLFSCCDVGSLESELIGKEYEISSFSFSNSSQRDTNNATLDGLSLISLVVPDSLSFIFTKDSIKYLSNKKIISSEKIKLNKNQMILNDVKYKITKKKDIIALISKENSDTVFLKEMN